MTADIYIALMHHPVLNKDGEVVNTAVTNMDLHDLARLARTYGIRAYYVIQPLALQRRLVKKLIGYWATGRGAKYNRTRQEAFELVRLEADLESAVTEIESETGSPPKIVATTAKEWPGAIEYGFLRKMMDEGGSWLVLFGTGWGFSPEFLEESADHVLKPIDGAGEYNHLSVRMAAAVILDRLLGQVRGQ